MSDASTARRLFRTTGDRRERRQRRRSSDIVISNGTVRLTFY